MSVAITVKRCRKAVTILEDTERTARRVFGGAHPITKMVECTLENSRVVLRAREGTA